MCDVESLVKASHEAKLRAYCPYSKFQVGAAVLTEDGKVFTGCNVENVSYSLTICAERSALVKAVSEGHTRFKAIAVASNMPDTYIRPCGACRQFLLEFGKDYDVYMTKPDHTFIKSSPVELMPHGFTPLDLMSYEKPGN
ncbi:cytidine deaminase-like [Biomphalaria glabrata]|uniref:Cytidine deaminase n=1 Tax=Biomphalaria glabrata TaxID=6526 RepID=A0A9W2YCC9_BIOGL|nr:cytidine deaminase-like [Biomphalaria glabrata]XP_055860434.1 cytidine deaminase-like [Biomphalaria glabrata]XP_055860435.1 cytidine deaminase-like [Biomphalaria glabrata]